MNKENKIKTKSENNKKIEGDSNVMIIELENWKDKKIMAEKKNLKENILWIVIWSRMRKR